MGQLNISQLKSEWNSLFLTVYKESKIPEQSLI